MKLKIPYWPVLFGPVIIFALGFGLNALVMAANQNQMPVLIPGGCREPITDIIHTCMTPATRLKFLADWIVLTKIDAIASPGDLLLWFSMKIRDIAQILWACLIIRDYSKNSV
jgi:uncharacterized radical SAM superfamily protein